MLTDSIRNSAAPAPDPELIDLIDAYEMGGDQDEENEEDDGDDDFEGYL